MVYNVNFSILKLKIKAASCTVSHDTKNKSSKIHSVNLYKQLLLFINKEQQ